MSKCSFCKIRNIEKINNEFKTCWPCFKKNKIQEGNYNYKYENDIFMGVDYGAKYNKRELIWPCLSVFLFITLVLGIFTTAIISTIFRYESTTVYKIHQAFWGAFGYALAYSSWFFLDLFWIHFYFALNTTKQEWTSGLIAFFFVFIFILIFMFVVLLIKSIFLESKQF